MKIYKTSEIARCSGVHPNTVRLYEELGLIPKVERKAMATEYLRISTWSRLNLPEPPFR